MFPFVHHTIAALLQYQLICSDLPRRGPFLDTTTLEIKGWASTDSIFVPDSEDQRNPSLASLALECDDFVFLQNGLASMSSDMGIQAMINWGKADQGNDDTAQSSAEALLASLLATNRLEASIRLATGHTTAGRAPLLITMIEQLEGNDSLNSSDLVSVLRSLLLPNPGLNLRNLLWHGFIASLPRPWLALVLVLIVNLERIYSETGAPSANGLAQVQFPRLHDYLVFEPILNRGEELLKGNLHHIDVSWIQETNANPCALQLNHSLGSYQNWWKLITQRLVSDQKQPIIICILLTCLLEHGLRQIWCQDNHRHEDRIARPGVFYVTLDGHGQRYKHDVLLHPYVGDENFANATKNAMLDRLGGPIMALLTDLYCSPCGGPNLRASLAHGLWDTHLQLELSRVTNKGDGPVDAHQKEEQTLLWELVKVLLATMEALGEAVATTTGTKAIAHVEDYRPIFSYTAATCRNLEFAMNELHRLAYSLQGESDKLALATASLNLPLDDIRDLEIITLQSWLQQAGSLKTLCGGKEKLWGVEDILLEHESNKVLSSLGAARTLLYEVAEAGAAYRVALEQKDESSLSSSRKRKQHLRVLAASELAVILYQFAAFVAVLLLQNDLQTSNGTCGIGVDRDCLLKAVKRSRMVVSTVSNFVLVNTDRAIKAAREYSQGKAVKAIVRHYQLQQRERTILAL